MKPIFLILILILISSCASESIKVIRPTRIQSHESYGENEKINSEISNDVKKKYQQRRIQRKL